MKERINASGDYEEVIISDEIEIDDDAEEEDQMEVAEDEDV